MEVGSQFESSFELHMCPFMQKTRKFTAFESFLLKCQANCDCIIFWLLRALKADIYMRETVSKVNSDGINVHWMEMYIQGAQTCEQEWFYGLYHYPYESVTSTDAFLGGFFEHRAWPPQKGL